MWRKGKRQRPSRSLGEASEPSADTHAEIDVLTLHNTRARRAGDAGIKLPLPAQRLDLVLSSSSPSYLPLSQSEHCLPPIMASKPDHSHTEHIPPDAAALEKEAPMQHIAELQAAQHINLTWRSWVVVFVACFAIMAQVFVVVAAGSVIAFIIQDLGQ